MDLEKVGKVVTESLALQGRLEAINQECKSLDFEIINLNGEIKRLESLNVNKVAKEQKVKELKDEQLKVSGDLNKRLEILAKDGVVLPLGKVTINRATRL